MAGTTIRSLTQGAVTVHPRIVGIAADVAKDMAGDISDALKVEHDALGQLRNVNLFLSPKPTFQSTKLTTCTKPTPLHSHSKISSPLPIKSSPPASKSSATPSVPHSSTASSAHTLPQRLSTTSLSNSFVRARRLTSLPSL